MNSPKPIVEGLIEANNDVCMYVRKMSCYRAPCINYAYEPLGQCATQVLSTSTSHVVPCMVHCTVLLIDMEDAELEVEEDSARLLTVQRHKQNATEELRDCSLRRQGDRERRMHGTSRRCMYIASHHLCTESVSCEAFLRIVRLH